MNTDGDLLERYVRNGSEESFSELVSLRAGFVHAAALRRVGGDRHLAKDVTQQVFIALARNARQLSRHPVLSGWFYLTTRNIAAQILRTEQRRKKREKESATMHDIFAAAEPAHVDTQFREHLDAVLDELSERDRQVVLLRFFEGRSFAEIGLLAQLTENAARMRVERTLEKMHAAFSKRGVTSTAAALGAGLSALAGVTLPAALTATFAQTALASAGVGAGGVLGLTFMSLTKLQISAALIAVALGIGGVMFHEHRIAGLQQQIERLAEQNEQVTELRKENSRLKQTTAGDLHSNADRKISTPEDTEHNAAAVGAPKPSPKHHAVTLAVGLMPVENLDHNGRSTARAAFSTQIWAAAEGDVELEQSSIFLRPEAREKLEAVLTNLPASVRENYRTPERLMASVLAGSPHPVGGMQILGEQSQGENNVVLETQWQHVDDTIVHHSNVELQRDNSGNWQMVVPTVLVDRAVTYLKGNFNAMPAAANK